MGISPETENHDPTVSLPGPHTSPGTSPHRAGHMVICGADALAHRLAFELAGRYGQQIVVLTPSVRDGHGPRTAALGTRRGLPVTVVEAPGLDEDALTAADVQHAAALALTSGDDQANLHAALRARRLNPDLRLVVRVFNRRLGQRVEQLLDQAVLARHPGLSAAALEASTTVLSASSTATPSLVAAALGGRSHALHIDGRLLRVAEPEAGAHSDGTELAVLAAPSAPSAPAAPGSDPVLLPDLDSLGPGGDRTVLELLGRAAPPPRTRRRPGRGALPLGELFTRRLRWALAGLTALVLAFTALGWRISGQPPQHVAWLTVLDVLGIADPAEDDGPAGKTLQILAAIGGMLLMPFLIALALDALGTFRTATALRRPSRNLSGHVVLVGLGRVGSRVLDRLCELDVPVVCVDRDPSAPGVARARTHGVPVVIGDATQDGVLDAAKAGRARALLALTSDDGTNLEAALAARESAPGCAWSCGCSTTTSRATSTEPCATPTRTPRPAAAASPSSPRPRSPPP
ncbi:NAD-binding protein [Kitasatospora cineracea]|uniref:NAD-binding protein n=1 Tax=Kitasatospora cineracea TaxID=88074 RepID=UPI0037B3B4FC